ncbi:MAG: type III secretion system export apparatus subunit SctS, partial [Pseudomonadota bacterium]
SPSTIVDITQHALVLILLLSMPAVLTAAIVGVGVAMLQAVTQIQDQSIGQAVKFIAVSAAIALSAARIGSELLLFGQSVIRNVAIMRVVS